MRNVRILLSYDGSRFFGWQRQEGFVTVQEAVEEAFAALVADAVTVHGAGRTDTGVHALGQVANAHVETRLADERLLFALNAHLPSGIVAEALETCSDGFHAQRDACGKRYAYVVRTTRFAPPFGRDHCHWVPTPLDLAAMRRAAEHLVGEHDFSAFANAGSPRRSNVRRVRRVRLVARRDSLAFVVQGDGFLYNMVRTIAGTLLEIGRGKMRPDVVPELLRARDRTLAGPTAPPNGLFLVRVLYPMPVFGRSSERRRPGVFPD